MYNTNIQIKFKTSMLRSSKNCGPFTDCISGINNTQIDNAKYVNVVTPMYNLIEYTIIIWKHHEVCGNITEMIQMII